MKSIILLTLSTLFSAVAFAQTSSPATPTKTDEKVTPVAAKTEVTSAKTEGVTSKTNLTAAESELAAAQATLDAAVAQKADKVTIAAAKANLATAKEDAQMNQHTIQTKAEMLIRKPVADPNGRNVNAAVLAVAIRGIFQHVSSYVLRENRQQQLCRRRRELPGTPSLASCGRSSSFELAATDLPLGSGSKSSPGRTECFGPAILCGAAGLVSSMSDVLPRDNWIASLCLRPSWLDSGRT